MRLKEISLTGFRAFAKTTTVDLSADCTILVGKNGQGKTSLLDGLFWALTGQLERIGEDDSLVSLYSETGTASVSLTLSDGGEDLVVRRRFDGERTSLVCRLGGRSLIESEVHSRYQALLALPAESRTERAPSGAATTGRSLYLQQDAIRDFISADTDDSRFRVVADLCGLGRATELQAALQRERKAWSQATNKLRADLRSRQQRVSGLSQRASGLGALTETGTQLTVEWVDWWTRLGAAGVSPQGVVPEFMSGEASTALERAMRVLDAERMLAERRQEELTEAVRKARVVAGEPPQSEEDLKEAVEGAQRLEAQIRSALQAAERRNSEEGERQLRQKVSAAELRTLAELALRHLGDRCPVCDQGYDREGTEALLRRRVSTSGTIGSSLEDLEPLLARVAAARRQTAERIEVLRAVEAKNARTEQLRAELGEVFERLGVEAGIGTDQAIHDLDNLRAEIGGRLGELLTLRAAGEELALAIARSREWVQRAEVERQLETAKTDLEGMEGMLAARERAGRVATTIIEEIREASLQIVDEELQRMEPLLQRIWAGIDPHPSLRAVSLVSRLGYGKGRLSMKVRDEVADVFSDAPGSVLSSSQLNALAVALFLTLNLGTEALPLRATVLDDPFQALDDINLLGLIDLLRRIGGGRQLILATHESKLGRLLARKLRPVEGGRVTRVVEFDRWCASGPEVTERLVGGDRAPFRFVA